MDHAQRIVLKEPADMAGAQLLAHHHDKQESLEGSARAPASSWVAPVAVAVGVPLHLPQGCAVGIPVSAGFAAMQLPEGNNLLPIAMNFVQADDYHGIMELARVGAADAMTEKRRCGFALALKPEGGVMSDLPVNLRVRGATLLHYAVCIGSFRAAAALLVVNPALLKGTCLVETSDGSSGAPVQAEVWCAAELARLFCVLYEGGDGDDEVLATSLLFEQALKVLELGTNYPEQLPFVTLPTVHERVAAAGWDAEAAVQAFFAAAGADDWSPMTLN